MLKLLLICVLIWPLMTLLGQTLEGQALEGQNGAMLHGELDLAPVLSLNPADEPRLGFSGSVLTMIEGRQKNVRAELSLKLRPSLDGPGIPVLLDRAALRIRLPISRGQTSSPKIGAQAETEAQAETTAQTEASPYYFRITAGKTVLPWGEGFVFNSGDLPGNSTSLLGSLSGSSLRDTSSWLLALNFPLGRFSFVELLGQAAAWEGDLSSGNFKPKNIGRSSAGLRFLLQAGAVKFEFGGLYKGETLLSDTGESRRSLRSYFGIKSVLGDIDFYVQGSLTWLLDEVQPEFVGWDATKRYANGSAGFMWQVGIGQATMLSLRLELIASPFAAWEAVDSSIQKGQPIYGLWIYPELSLSHRQVNLFLRSLFSPVDASLLLSLGFDWSPYTGLSLYTYASMALGEKGDVFRLKGETNTGAAAVGLSLALGMRYSF